MISLFNPSLSGLDAAAEGCAGDAALEAPLTASEALNRLPDANTHSGVVTVYPRGRDALFPRLGGLDQYQLRLGPQVLSRINELNQGE